MDNHLSRRHRVIAAIVCMALCTLLQAQSGDTTATAGGTVADVAGKPIANAAVSVKSESAGAARQATTDSDGKFSVSGLPDGLCTIEASSPS